MIHHYSVNVTIIHVVLVVAVKSLLLVTSVFAVQVKIIENSYRSKGQKRTVSGGDESDAHFLALNRSHNLN